MSAEKKALTYYRKLVSKANQFIETVQTKQCSVNWKHIDFDNHVTSTTLSKQKYAFLNRNKTNKSTHLDAIEDRTRCAENYSEYIECCKKKDSIIENTI